MGEPSISQQNKKKSLLIAEQNACQVRGRGSDKKYQATCYAVGEECDLAILTVEDESFWEETSPLSFGELPELTDQVSVIG